MKQPDLKGDLAESLYSFDEETKTESKLANPGKLHNPNGRPALIPGIEYPISDEEEKMLDLAWDHFCNLKSRGLL